MAEDAANVKEALLSCSCWLHPHLQMAVKSSSSSSDPDPDPVRTPDACRGETVVVASGQIGCRQWSTSMGFP